MKSIIKYVYPSAGTRSLLMILFLLCPFITNSTAEVIDRVVAEVNTQIITLSEIEEEGESAFQRIVQEAPPEQRDELLVLAHKEVLDNLIDKTLISTEAERKGITVSEEELDAAIEQIITSNNITREILLEDLEKNGIDETIYRSNLRSQIYQNKLVTTEVRSKIIITEEMILDYYDTSYTSRVSEGGYYLLQIGTSWEAADEAGDDPQTLLKNKAAARERVEQIHKLALGGQDFRNLAQRYSDLPSAAEGGDIGSFEEEEMASYMRDGVTSLKAGEISPIVETPVGYQFFKLLSSKEGGIVVQAPYETVKDEIRERLFSELMEKEFETWIKGVRDRAYIRIL